MRLGVTIYLSILCMQLLAQDWVTVAGGLDQSVESLVEFDESLIITGDFTNNEQAGALNGVAVWNGETISSLTSQEPIEDWVGGVGGAKAFEDKLFFICSTPDGFEGFDVNKVFSWDGNVISMDFNPQYQPQAFQVFQNELIVSQAGTSEGTASFYMWNGLELDSASYTGFVADGISFSLIQSMREFQGELYLGGNIFSTTSYKDLLSWDGDEFNDLGGGIPGDVALVTDLEIFNDELIVAGYFFQADGNPTNCIMRWNGSEFLPMGQSGANNRVDCLLSHNGFLYAAGMFTEMDDEEARVALWDGTGWSSLSDCDFAFNNISQGGLIRAMTVFEDELYVGGVFHEVDGEPFGHIAKFNGILPTSIPSIESHLQIEIYPNPAHDRLEFRNLPIGDEMRIEILTLSGQPVSRLVLHGTKTHTADISFLIQGVYIISFADSRILPQLLVVK